MTYYYFNNTTNRYILYKVKIIKAANEFVNDCRVLELLYRLGRQLIVGTEIQLSCDHIFREDEFYNLIHHDNRRFLSLIMNIIFSGSEKK